jgi:hypothetical protein
LLQNEWDNISILLGQPVALLIFSGRRLMMQFYDKEGAEMIHGLAASLHSPDEFR